MAATMTHLPLSSRLYYRMDCYMNNEIQFIWYQLPEEEGKVLVVNKDETIWATQRLCFNCLVLGFLMSASA